MSHIRTHVEHYRLLLIQQARKYVLDEKFFTADFFRSRVSYPLSALDVIP